MNLQNIPKDIQESQQFCLWKSVLNSNPTLKSIKKPYGFCQKTQKLIPSLKNPKYWLNWEGILNIIPNLSKEWGLGLVLNGGPYVVIDLDNCIFDNKNPSFLEPVLTFIAMFKGSYIEISPSGKGLHIIFKGAWPYKRNRGIRPLDVKLNKGTIEVYSGKDCRFITLTGFAFNKYSNCNQQLSSGFAEEMRFLYFKYIEKDLINSSLLQTVSSNNYFQDLMKVLNSNLTTEHFQKKIQSIKQKIQISNHFDHYLYLCQANPGNHKSMSEADWHFCLFVLKFFGEEDIKDPELLKQFLVSERSKRHKLDRLDYIDRTACKAIQKAIKDNLIGCLQNQRQYSSEKVSKKNIIKICNIMNIFQLGVSKQRSSICQIINDDPDNYLEATIPISLNQIDYDYYIQILQQIYLQHHEDDIDVVSNKSFSVKLNVTSILNNLGLSKGGMSYLRFLKSLNKLAAVTLEYDKKISKDNLRYKGRVPLLSYEYMEKISKKRVFVTLHPLVSQLLIHGDYNYAIFNLKSYKTFNNSYLRLLYYYFSMRTIPGGYPVNFSLEGLLSLWAKSVSRSVIFRRKRFLVQTLKSFVEQSKQIQDLDSYLLQDRNRVLGISVRKRKLKVK